MPQFLSQKIKILSFLSIILVLYIHSGFHDYLNEIHGMKFNFMLQDFISGMIGRCAVPLFYAISGYLFFIGLIQENHANYQKMWIKIKKRFRTLLVPYIIACIFPLVFLGLLECIPIACHFMNGGGFWDNIKYPIPQLICFLYIDSGNGTPFAFHLWFLRDLIAIVILSPALLWLVIRVGKYWVCLICLVLCYLPIPVFPVYGMFWFVFGLCFLDKLSAIKSVTVPILFLALSILELLFPSIVVWNYLRIPIIISGIVFIWTLYDRVCPDTFCISEHRVWMNICGYTFFIYLYHEPALNIIRKIIVLPFHQSSLGFAISYLASPWIFAMVWICVGMILRKILPNVYNICMGGR